MDNREEILKKHPGLKQAKYTAHPDIECKMPAVLTIDMKAKWKIIDAMDDESTRRACLNIINQAIQTLTIWKDYLEQEIEN